MPNCLGSGCLRPRLADFSWPCAGSIENTSLLVLLIVMPFLWARCYVRTEKRKRTAGAALFLKIVVCHPTGASSPSEIVWPQMVRVPP